MVHSVKSKDNPIYGNAMKPKDDSNACYMLFAGDISYPSGGWEDFIGYFPSIESSKEAAMEKELMDYRFGWAQIVNTVTHEIMLMGHCLIPSSKDPGKWDWYRPDD